MAFDAASFFDSIRAAKTWAARYVGISGLGTNPTNPWCQHPSRPPLHYLEPVWLVTVNRFSLTRERVRHEPDRVGGRSRQIDGRHRRVAGRTISDGKDAVDRRAHHFRGDGSHAGVGGKAVWCGKRC
jgi:hypothetical protein